jgi:hypothetical protein
MSCARPLSSILGWSQVIAGARMEPDELQKRCR